MFPFPFPFVVFTNWFVLSLNKICSVTLKCCIQNEVLRYDSVKLHATLFLLFFCHTVLYIFLVSSSFLIFVVNINFGNFNFLSDLYSAQEVPLFLV